ncbi:M20/M25/M40 family metallo-hydrolase [Ideonella sp. DXS29W]|uniref:M20/M25/M40 family metallo-hydrolase n=1 Tax=Ideonella lacteola TaxID=2984193 RepID=A0ABU9BN98_9BURK
MKKLHRAALLTSTLATCFMASAHAGPMVWASMGEDAYRFLRRAGADLQQVEPFSVSIRAPQADGRVGRRDETVYLMQVDEDALPQLSRDVHEKLGNCAGFMVHATRAEGRQAVQGFREAAQRGVKPLISYAIDNDAEVTPLLSQIQESNIRATIEQLSTGYKNRYYTTSGGVSASDQLAASWRALAGSRTDVTVSQFTHPSWPQKSVILEIKGTTNPGKIVVIGGHLDSILLSGTNENSIAPGADDDASGVASLQEAMRVLLSSGYKPKRTLQFMAYAAEEVGLRGSQGIATDYKNKGKKVVGVLQLDMTNYQGSSSDITMITDYTNSAQNKFVKDLAAHYLPTLKVNEDRCGYACSDHASWTNKGYVASFPFEAPLANDNKLIHTSNDTLAKSGNNANHALKFSKLALAYLVELGSDGK